MQFPSSINSFEQVLKLYGVTRQPEIQRKTTAVKIIHNKLVDFIRGILSNTSTLPQTELSLRRMINSNIKVLAENDAFTTKSDETAFDIKALKVAFLASYSEFEGSDNPTGSDFIKFLETQCENPQTSTRQPLPGSTPLEEQIRRHLDSLPKTSEFATRGYEYTRGVMGLSSTFMRAVFDGTFFQSDSTIMYAHPS